MGRELISRKLSSSIMQHEGNLRIPDLTTNSQGFMESRQPVTSGIYSISPSWAGAQIWLQVIPATEKWHSSTENKGGKIIIAERQYPLTL